MTQTRVNIKTLVNSSKIRKERRNGRDVIVVPSATMPDNIVMNGIRYPADEIDKSYQTLENTIAPLGHPNIDGAFVSASDPDGLVRGFIGAYNKNVRRENGRVFIDKIIDVEYAKNSEGGKAVLEAIEKQEPIHTSTGLYAIMTATNDDEDAQHVASDIIFDHDAILIGEDGAATPSQGVGIFVNAKDKDGNQIPVINSVWDDSDRELGWAIESAIRSAEKQKQQPLIERIKTMIKEAISGFGEDKPTDILPENNMAVTDEQFNKLSADVAGLTEAFKGINEAVANAVAGAVKPLTESLEAAQNAQKAKDEAELTELRGKIVNAKLLTEEVASELTLNSARALAGKITGTAFALNAAAKQSGETDSYELPSEK